MISKNVNKIYLVAVGSFSLVISILLGRVMIDVPILNFLEGIFMGIAFATNLGYIIIYSLEKGTLSKMKNQMEVE